MLLYIFQNISYYFWMIAWSLRVWLSFCLTLCQFPLGVVYISVACAYISVVYAYISVVYAYMSVAHQKMGTLIDLFNHFYIFLFLTLTIFWYFIGILNRHNDEPLSVTVIMTSRDNISICEWPISKFYFQKKWSNCRSLFWNDNVTLVKLLIFSGLSCKYILKVLLNGS